MKCEWVKSNVVLYVYNELADDARYELEQHVGRCADCAAELKSTQEFQTVFSTSPVEEPSPNLLAASRMRLQESLETATQGGFWQRLAFEPAMWLRQVKFAPALAAAIFIVGFAGGIGVTYRFLNANRNVGPIATLTPSSSSQPAVESSISGIRSVTQDPGSDKVTIKYDTVSTQQAQGSLNDTRIQQLLLFAARNNYNSGVRMDSVDLLTQSPADMHVREALIYALRYDTNPGVRLRALDGLGTYVKSDVQVRDAVLGALMNDANPGVRTEAIHLLEPVRADSTVRAVLTELAAKDSNQYIRTQARNTLAEMPEMD
ncbi:MAG TPA: HEAT repeat domain-containing protein [Terriglobales bacterium]